MFFSRCINSRNVLSYQILYCCFHSFILKMYHDKNKNEMQCDNDFSMWQVINFRDLTLNNLWTEKTSYICCSCFQRRLVLFQKLAVKKKEPIKSRSLLERSIIKHFVSKMIALQNYFCTNSILIMCIYHCENRFYKHLFNYWWMELITINFKRGKV